VPNIISNSVAPITYQVEIHLICRNRALERTF
jgi:hypothetical protein